MEFKSLSKAWAFQCACCICLWTSYWAICSMLSFKIFFLWDCGIWMLQNFFLLCVGCLVCTVATQFCTHWLPNYSICMCLSRSFLKKNIKHDSQFHDHIKILLAKIFNLHNDYNSYIIHSTPAIGANLATFKNWKNNTLLQTISSSKTHSNLIQNDSMIDWIQRVSLKTKRRKRMIINNNHPTLLIPVWGWVFDSVHND